MTFGSFVEKLKALGQWWYQLERTEHRHWCSLKKNPWLGPWKEAIRDICDGQTGCWKCVGIKCAAQTYKDCPVCKPSKPLKAR